MTNEAVPSSRREARQRAASTFTSRTSYGMSLLSAIVSNGATNVLRRCRAELFTDEERRSWEAIDRYHQRHGRLPGVDALRELQVNLPEATDPPLHYYQLCLDRLTYNALSSRATHMLEHLRNRRVSDAVTLLREMQAAIPAQDGLRDLSTLSEELDNFREGYLQDRWSPGLRGITTGYPPIDEETNGLLPGDVGVLVGRPGQGKSWNLLHMVRSAWRAGRSVLVVSMEMTPQQLVKRLVSMEAGVSSKAVQQARLSTWAQDRVMTTLQDMVDGTPPVHFVAGKFRKSVKDIAGYVAETCPDVVYVDGGYLIGPDNTGRYSAKHERIADVIEGLKSVAVDSRIPFMVTVQFNREVRKKVRGDLDLAQIGGSDAIGQVATLVMGLREGPKGSENTRRILELMKNREGELLRIVTNFQFSPPSFTWMEGEQPDDPDSRRVSRELAESMI